MKRVMVVAVGMFVIFAMASISYGAVWPPAKPGLLKALSCTEATTTNYCAVITLRGGSTEVACKTGDKIVENICKPASTVTQKCDNGAIVNVYDAPAIKCQKVCKPDCSPWK